MFKDKRPPYFDDEADSFIAEDWLEEIENIFEAMECPDEKKVILATTAMRKDAQYWWKSDCRTQFAGRSQHDITWEEFTELLREHFVPPSIREISYA
ncbi:hypothetical protein AXF42_Ash011029 [Apostasia shenzhenica]|uniref:Retrotransposon gag domain-containing protein n=1 Tax=Apostasia shenzhenica TaxID=1088818 RepID=A0A2H9ZQX6_9ASPA|nr:hypothetical protein AXF42_Ash011029 [Apostasia shenzhenica]